MFPDTPPAWAVDWASWTPWLLLLLLGTCIAAGAWRLATRKSRRLARSVAARRMLRERGVGAAGAQARRERQVAPKAPDTGPQERSTQAGTNSVSMPQPAPAPAAPAAPNRPPVDARAATVALDIDLDAEADARGAKLDAYPLPQLDPAPRVTAPADAPIQADRVTAPEPASRATQGAQVASAAAPAPAADHAPAAPPAASAPQEAAPNPSAPPPGVLPAEAADAEPTLVTDVASAVAEEPTLAAAAPAEEPTVLTAVPSEEATAVTEVSAPRDAGAKAAGPHDPAAERQQAEVPAPAVAPSPLPGALGPADARQTEVTVPAAPAPGQGTTPAEPRSSAEVTPLASGASATSETAPPPAARATEATEVTAPPPPPTVAAAPAAPPADVPSDVQARTTVLQPVAPEPPAPPPVAAAPDAEELAALEAGVAKSRAGLWGRLRHLFAEGQPLDAAALNDCEDVLLGSDVGVAMAERIVEALQTAAAAQKEALGEAGLRALLRRELLGVLHTSAQERPAVPLSQVPAAGRPKVVLFVGVNGVGKTTTVGKVAHLLGGAGYRVVLAAGDTYRAAAAEQLTIWGERTGARVVRGDEGSDPASVMYNAVEAAKADGADIVLADTAGRLHTQNDLMDQIKKVGRALSKLRAGAPDEVWLVVDATTGQNALHQARAFHEALGLTGLVLTKLDGTAKGGVLFAIAHELKLPVRFVGLGERADALRAFAPEPFVDALLR